MKILKYNIVNSDLVDYCCIENHNSYDTDVYVLV